MFNKANLFMGGLFVGKKARERNSADKIWSLEKIHSCLDVKEYLQTGGLTKGADRRWRLLPAGGFVNRENKKPAFLGGFVFYFSIMIRQVLP